mmetsp:Transcript_71163/g.179746  ORF Transcript_71163/g.179746 Transcript_71163/m.179746 type:complete len:246 (-) Transcript_71163:160-897(-)
MLVQRSTKKPDIGVRRDDVLHNHVLHGHALQGVPLITCRCCEFPIDAGRLCASVRVRAARRLEPRTALQVCEAIALLPTPTSLLEASICSLDVSITLSGIILLTGIDSPGIAFRVCSLEAQIADRSVVVQQETDAILHPLCADTIYIADALATHRLDDSPARRRASALNVHTAREQVLAVDVVRLCLELPHLVASLLDEVLDPLEAPLVRTILTALRLRLVNFLEGLQLWTNFAPPELTSLTVLA